jgi:hypothetical protein
MKKGKEMNEKLQSGIPLDEILSNYENHREKYADVRKEAGKGWRDVAYKHEINYNPVSPYHLNKAYGEKYNQHNTEEVITDIPYWDTKENDEYFSLSRTTRIKMFIKEKVNFIYYKEFLIFNFLLILILTYYSNKKSKQIIL